MAKKPDIVSRLDSMNLGQNRRQTWFTRLPPARQQELLEFRNAYTAGHWDGRTSDRELFQAVINDLELGIKFTAFANWAKQR